MLEEEDAEMLTVVLEKQARNPNFASMDVKFVRHRYRLTVYPRFYSPSGKDRLYRIDLAGEERCLLVGPWAPTCLTALLGVLPDLQHKLDTLMHIHRAVFDRSRDKWPRCRAFGGTITEERSMPAIVWVGLNMWQVCPSD